MTEIKIPEQFSHNVKLSDTSKGVRIDIHVYANDRETAIREAMETYLETREACKINDIVLAPFEMDSKK